ncbi:MAG: TIGR02453 family protein [Gemmatimonas sp.]|nr:TIGR02453 family protein [Gemmatimonas sp.]
MKTIVSAEPTSGEDGGKFDPELFDFLRELRQNNNREWFTANKERYETFVLQPLLRFVEAFGSRLGEISPHFMADARRMGGSIFRIYRDTRFSSDKSPYKTNAAAHFRHSSAAKDVHAPGFYLHLEQGRCLGGGGSWHPDRESLGKIRDRIVAAPAEWESVRASGIALDGDSLKRPPTGYPADHHYVQDLKRKDFFVMTSFSDAEVCSSDFVDRYLAACKDAAPLVRFLTTALDLPF